MKLFSKTTLFSLLFLLVGVFNASAYADCEDTGKNIGRKMDKLNEDAKDKAQEAKEKAEDIGDKTKDKAKDIHDDAKDKAHDIIDKM